MPADETLPLPFRARVKHALCACLEEISPVHGFRSDLTEFVHEDGQPMKRVYRGRAFFGDNDPLPMVAILERPDPNDPLADPPLGARKQSYEFNLIVQGFVEDDKSNPTDDADILLSDVKMRLARERDRKDPTGKLPDPLGFGPRGANRVEELSFGAGVVRPADEVSSKAYFWLGVTLKVIEDPLSPFA